MRLTDGKRTINIEMQVWEENGCTGYGPDFSLDFFNAGDLPYDEEKELYIVDDVDYCIDQANDWKNSIGDFSCDVPNENNAVFIEDIED